MFLHIWSEKVRCFSYWFHVPPSLTRLSVCLPQTPIPKPLSLSFSPALRKRKGDAARINQVLQLELISPRIASAPPCSGRYFSLCWHSGSIQLSIWFIPSIWNKPLTIYNFLSLLLAWRFRLCVSAWLWCWFLVILPTFFK